MSNIAQSRFAIQRSFYQLSPKDGKEPLRSIVITEAVSLPICHQCGKALFTIMEDDERQAALIRLWLECTDNSRTGDHLVVFHGWLQRNRPDLLPFDDAYQNLKSDLRLNIRK